VRRIPVQQGRHRSTSPIEKPVTASGGAHAARFSSGDLHRHPGRLEFVLRFGIAFRLPSNRGDIDNVSMVRASRSTAGAIV